MVAKLPRWVEFGAFILALNAGFINAVGLLDFEHQAVSHLSGTATLIGTQLVSSPVGIFHLIGIVLCFLLGASVSGVLLAGSSLKLGRHYDTLLFLEACLLVAAIFFLEEQSLVGHYFASAACGLQNALATKYSGAVVRTTHMTGIVTDLGIMLGAVLRGKALDRRKALLFFLILLGFVSGGALGALVFGQFYVSALLLPAVICCVLAICYRIYRSRVRR
ncbi:YoaK family protein [Litoribrevibacter albus]|uniref:Permease n=1 Tax=Litoribrevibacter albus TaxID=1473156 RepID=A0AA37SAR8_9GAMM|nr:YoaK family protein [Litoribrevibacter albus]GLQ31771.1 permease [Litoribrevibacter albus]